MKSDIKYILLILTFLSLTNVISLAQPDSSITKNTIFIEGLGNGIIGSVNYDRLILTNKNKFSFRMGFLYIPDSKNYISGYSIPIEFNYLNGRKNHLEFGLGLTYAYGLYTQTDYYGKKELSQAIYLVIKPIGYRFQKSSGGLFFRLNGLLLYRTVEMNKNYVIGRKELTFFPLIGLSIGYSFKNKKS